MIFAPLKNIRRPIGLRAEGSIEGVTIRSRHARSRRIEERNQIGSLASLALVDLSTRNDERPIDPQQLSTAVMNQKKNKTPTSKVLKISIDSIVVGHVGRMPMKLKYQRVKCVCHCLTYLKTSQVAIHQVLECPSQQQQRESVH